MTPAQISNINFSVSKFFQLFVSRDERRWMEKQNRAMRQKRKKEETARLRTLVGKVDYDAILSLESLLINCMVY